MVQKNIKRILNSFSRIKKISFILLFISLIVALIVLWFGSHINNTFQIFLLFFAVLLTNLSMFLLIIYTIIDIVKMLNDRKKDKDNGNIEFWLNHRNNRYSSATIKQIIRYYGIENKNFSQKNSNYLTKEKEIINIIKERTENEYDGKKDLEHWIDILENTGEYEGILSIFKKIFTSILLIILYVINTWLIPNNEPQFSEYLSPILKLIPNYATPIFYILLIILYIAIFTIFIASYKVRDKNTKKYFIRVLKRATLNL